MKSTITKRSIVIDGHKTSVSLEDAFWSGLKEIAQDQHRLCRTWSAKSKQAAFMAIYRPPFGFLCSMTSGPRPRDLLETMPNPPCGTEKTHTVKDESL